MAKKRDFAVLCSALKHNHWTLGTLEPYWNLVGPLDPWTLNLCALIIGLSVATTRSPSRLPTNQTQTREGRNSS
jgi:hypothetical protein